MSIKSYLIQLLYDQSSSINNDLLFVVIPVLSITILMFGLRSLLLDLSKTKLQK